MQNIVGKALAEFEAAFQEFREQVGVLPQVLEVLLEDTREWSDLLTYKLVPHLAGEGCLVAAVAGGTNTGKSTVFNLLVGEAVSPVVNTAAATCHPVLAASASRSQQCLKGKLVPEFRPLALERSSDITNPEVAPETLFVAASDRLPDSLVIMDTPDVDSIDRRNWVIADHLRAAGDLVIAILTGEKYKDERVVEFFREAAAAGRVVLPVMNKANPEEGFAVARKQLDEFLSDVGIEAPCFVIPHDFAIATKLDRPVESLDAGADLRSYLGEADVPAIKARVYKGTVTRFAERAGEFLERVGGFRRELGDALDSLDAVTRRTAAEYEPVPGKEIGGLFHEFVQSKRGVVRRYIGATSATIARGATAIGRTVRGSFLKRSKLESEEAITTAALYRIHKQTIERLTRNLATSLIDRSRALRPTFAETFAPCFETLDVEAAMDAVTKDVLQSEDISEAFREHATHMLETWWNDHQGRRRALEALDTILAVMPAAIAAPMAIYTAGVGVSEAMVVVGPLAAQFVTRVMEYQFGDAMFDFISPWKEEQQEKLRAAFQKHLIEPCTHDVTRVFEVLEGPVVDRLRRSQELCLNP